MECFELLHAGYRSCAESLRQEGMDKEQWIAGDTIRLPDLAWTLQTKSPKKGRTPSIREKSLQEADR